MTGFDPVELDSSSSPTVIYKRIIQRVILIFFQNISISLGVTNLENTL